MEMHHYQQITVESNKADESLLGYSSVRSDDLSKDRYGQPKRYIGVIPRKPFRQERFS